MLSSSSFIVTHAVGHSKCGLEMRNSFSQVERMDMLYGPVILSSLAF